MEFNNLLKKLKSSNDDEPRQFLALALTDETIQAAVWHVRNAKTEVVNIGSIENWNDANSDSDKLLESADITISKAIENSTQEINEVVFGLPKNWVKEKIIPAKLKIIKTISKNLELKPLGFVVIIESLIHYLKIREGTPATAIFTHVSDTEVTVSLVKLGRIISSHSVGRSDDLCQDVEEGISRFKVSDNLPSRIVVYNGTQNLEEVTQNLTSYDWQNKFNFLHLPKIETLPKDAVITAVAIAGGSEVAKSIGFEIDFDKEETPESQVSGTETTMTSDLSSKPDESQDEDHKSNELGFVTNIDVAKLKSEKPVSRELNIKSPDSSSPHSTKNKIPKLSLSASPLSVIKNISIPRPKFFKQFSLKQMRPSVIIAIAGLTLLIGGVAAALYFVPKTQITIYVEPKVHDESLSLTISQKTSSVDLENTTIPGQRVSKSVSGNASANSTGSKLIGDKAKGEVTIYNRTSLTKTLKNQTTLTLNDLEFTLDEDVTIASESADTDYSPGKASVKITASTIGEDSNLPSGSELIIASYSKDSFVAKNNNDLSGGTSQEIRVVAEEDQENLKTKLISTLQEDAKNALTQEASDQIGIFIQEELTEILQENYSADIGDETDSLSLDLEIEAKGLKYNKQDIEDLIAQRVEETTPDGYERSNQPIEVETSSAVKESDESITLDAFIKVKLLPKIDIDQLVNAIKGKSGSDLDEILKQIPGFKKAEAILGPRWLPPRLKKLSPNPKNITIIIETI